MAGLISGASYLPGYAYIESAIIRPPKHVYDLKHLGPRRISVKGVIAVREDYTLQNPHNETLHVSQWR